jgi:hypothetical protein
MYLKNNAAIDLSALTYLFKLCDHLSLSLKLMHLCFVAISAIWSQVLAIKLNTFLHILINECIFCFISEINPSSEIW